MTPASSAYESRIREVEEERSALKNEVDMLRSSQRGWRMSCMACTCSIVRFVRS